MNLLNYILSFKAAINRISYALLIRSLGLIFSFFLTFVLLDILEARDLGVFYFIISLARLSSIFLSLGTFAAIIPEFSRSSDENKNSILITSIFPAIFLSIVGLISINLIFFFFNESLIETFWYIPLFSILVACYLLQFNLYHYFNCKEQLALTSFMLEGNGRNFFFLPSILFFYFFLDPSKLDLRLIVNLLIISSVISVLIGLFNYDFKNSIKDFSFSTFKKFHFVGIKFFPSVLVSTGAPSIYEIFINYFFGPVALAVLGVANRVLSPLMIHNDLLVLNFAKASKFFKGNNKNAANSLHIRSINFSFLIAFILLIIFYIFGYDIVSELLDFQKLPFIREVIMLFFLSTIFQSICNFSLHFLRNIGDYISMTYIETSALLLTILAMVFVSDLGIIGAALAILFGRMFMQISGFFYTKVKYGIPFFKE